MSIKKTWSICRKWLIIAILSGGTFILAFPNQAAIGVTTAPCMEECEDSRASCRDVCVEECDQTSSRQACNGCIGSCNTAYLSCLSGAVWCDIGNSYSPQCTVNYGTHCPIINGQADCNHASVYNDYFLICNTSYGQCVSCPSDRFCHGSNGLGACVPY